MKIYKTKQVITPNRGTKFSAGLDFYIPEFSFIFLKELKEKNKQYSLIIEADKITILPHNRVLIPSGIKIKIPSGYTLIAFNKSGISSQMGLDVLACVIDEDYQGEIHLNFVNTSTQSVEIKPNQKIVQFILFPISYKEVTEIETEEKLFIKKTKRGSGGFGSTNIEKL